MAKWLMLSQMWKLRLRWLGAALVAIVLWLGINAHPALGKLLMRSMRVGRDTSAATILLHSHAVVLSPNSSTTLVVQIRDADGRPFVGVTVNFSANLGAIDPAILVSDAKGVAEVTYTTNSSVGQVVVTAEVNGTTATAYLEIRDLSPGASTVNTVTIATNMTTLNPGERAKITVSLLDPAGSPVKDENVTLFASMGEVSPANGTTDAAGKVTATFLAGNYSGIAKIVALSGYSSRATEIQVIDVPGTPTATVTPTGTITITPTPTPTATATEAHTIHLPIITR